MKSVAILTLLLVAAAGATAGPSRKGKIRHVRKEAPEFRQAELGLREPASVVRRVCASPKLKVEVDWASFRGQKKEGSPFGAAAGLCETVMDGLKEWCEEREPKAPLTRQIDSVRCVYRKDALRFQAEKRAKTVLVYYGWETASLADEMKAWLKKEY